MEEIKALGPDGMCPLLFQTYWHIVGPTISKAVIGVLNGEGNCKTQILEIVLTIIISQNYKLNSLIMFKLEYDFYIYYRSFIYT